MSPAAPAAPALPQVPGAPPNPPMFGSSTTGQAGARQRKAADSSGGYAGSILGSGNPTNTGQKTLLGQ